MFDAVVPPPPNSTIQLVKTDPTFAVFWNSIPFQNPGVGVTLFAVNVTPEETSFPETIRPVPALNFTTTPFSMVNDTPFCIVTELVTAMGLLASVQMVSDVITPAAEPVAKTSANDFDERV
jgi:hypothetical protein